jgi:uncharacterized DUF497 family protein
MRFEWDAIKASVNFLKHKVAFAEAMEVFYDPNALENYDAGHSTSETRFSIIGFSSRRLLFVVFTEDNGQNVRIISARRATSAEREFYEGRIIR